MMHADAYQTAAARTLIDRPEQDFTPKELAIIFAALDIGAKAGKVLEYVKKGICHRHGYDQNKLDRLLVETVISVNKLMLIEDQEHERLILSGNDQMLLWCALGIGGEAGEVAESVGMLRSFDLFDPDDLTKELGDISWYLAGLATLIDVPLSKVFERNIVKLQQRYPNGYASADSKARVDTKKPVPAAGTSATCSQCLGHIVYIGPYWDHPGEIKPKHPAIPVEYEL